MSNLTTFRAVIELWPTREALASDLSPATAAQVSKWWQRRNIPSEWWKALLATDVAKSNGVDAVLLTRLAAHERAEIRA